MPGGIPGGRLPGLLLGHQLLLGELPDHGLRQFVAELHMTRTLDPRELVVEESQQLLGAQGLVLLEPHVGLGHLALVLVGHAGDRDFGDGRMAVDRLLHHARIDVVAGADDEVLDAVDEEQEAVFVEIADVAGVDPTALEGLGRRLGAIPVARHGLRSGDADLARFADGKHLLAFLQRANFDPRAGQRQADRPVLADADPGGILPSCALQRVAGHHRRRL